MQCYYLPHPEAEPISNSTWKVGVVLSSGIVQLKDLVGSRSWLYIQIVLCPTYLECKTYIYIYTLLRTIPLLATTETSNSLVSPLLRPFSWVATWRTLEEVSFRERICATHRLHQASRYQSRVSRASGIQIFRKAASPCLRTPSSILRRFDQPVQYRQSGGVKQCRASGVLDALPSSLTLSPC